MIKKDLLIVGNWKMNKTPQEAQKFLGSFHKLYKNSKVKIHQKIQFGFGVPSVDISIVAKNKVKADMIVAAQNFFSKDSGAFTGELSPGMIKAVGANAVIIGHSERRKHFFETDKDVNNKIKAALKNKILPIVCVGETLEQRKSKKWKSFLSKQIKSLFTEIKAKDWQKIIIAYEPIWAIGTGMAASSKQAQEACKYVRSRIAKETSETISQKIIIQYGGSVNPENISELMQQPDINGALVGGASLDPKSFIKLISF